AGDVFAVTVNGKTYSYTATSSDTSLDQIASQLATKVNADSTLGVTAVAGVGSLQLVGSNNNVSFDVSTTVNGQIPELTSGFFTGTDRYSFAINASLLDGSQQLKRNAASDVVNALNNSSRNFVATGLSVTNVSYSGLVSNVIGTASTNAKTVSDQAKLNSDTLAMTQQQYQTSTGVNLDEEIANLQVLQNAYAASARLLNVIQTMFDTLQQAVSH
ncbi:MAG TPA: flagellar basal body rod C-terminal domain-containing protein, partial [Terriglobales bacterium]|nr:flagellar basal body rod C-terminal domain-containing protein [Terriglobales bacterium]